MTSNISKRFVGCSFAFAALAITASPTFAQLPHSAGKTASEINAANNLLRDGKVDEALDAYRHVVPNDQQRNELNYNIAVAEYRKGNIDAAEKLFSEVAGNGSPGISSNSRYNLGNCWYAKALQTAEQDKRAAIEFLRQAISHYRGALRADPRNPDARANIELARELINKLEQEQQDKDDNQPQEKEQSEQKNDQQQNQQDKSQESDSGKDDSQKDNEQQKPDSQDSESDQSKNENPGDEHQKPDDQKSPGEESQSDQQQTSEQQSPSQPQGSDSLNDRQQPGDAPQPDAEEKPDEQEEKKQPVPAGDLKSAGQEDEDQKPANSVVMPDPNARDGLMTREEALKMLQSVRDRDMLRRMQQQRRERSRHVPVERDW